MDKKDYIYLLAFTTTVLFSLNYLKFANKNKIILFRNFDLLTKTTGVFDGGACLERLNDYLIFLLCFITLKLKFSTIFLIYGFKKAT